jgi:hypothetical protein
MVHYLWLIFHKEKWWVSPYKKSSLLCSYFGSLHLCPVELSTLTAFSFQLTRGWDLLTLPSPVLLTASIPATPQPFYSSIPHLLLPTPLCSFCNLVVNLSTLLERFPKVPAQSRAFWLHSVSVSITDSFKCTCRFCHPSISTLVHVSSPKNSDFLLQNLKKMIRVYR